MKAVKVILISVLIVSIAVGGIHVFYPLPFLPDIRHYFGLGPTSPPPVRMAEDSAAPTPTVGVIPSSAEKSTTSEAKSQGDKLKSGFEKNAPEPALPPPPALVSQDNPRKETNTSTSNFQQVGNLTPNVTGVGGEGKREPPAANPSLGGTVPPGEQAASSKPLLKLADPDEFIVEVVKEEARPTAPPPPPLPIPGEIPVPPPLPAPASP